MTIKLAVIMDPIEGIKVHKDSTFAMLLEAQNRGYEVYYLQAKDLYLNNDLIYANCLEINVQDNANDWFTTKNSIQLDMSNVDVILMRKDPPFNMEYIYTTYLLDRVEEQGTLVINHPASLRDANEKLFATKFKNCITPYIVTQQQTILNRFIDEHKNVVVKPLDGMAGDSIFQIDHNDANRNVILETITQLDQRTVMAQKLIPEYVQGDKRVILINGEPIPYALLRVPSKGELRANLAKGGSAQGVELSARDQYICAEIGPTLRAMQLSFVGIDIIGEYLTEINVTSPTGIRELDKMYDLNICATLFDHIENQLKAN